MSKHQSYPPLPTYLETAPRYTTLAAVKEAVGLIDNGQDTEVTEAIVSIEALIDAHLGTTYPQDADPNVGTGDALDPPPIEGIPIQLAKAAKLGAITLFKLDDAPFGSAGGDDFAFGMVEPDNAGKAFSSVKPLLLGLRRGFPIG